jgi:hypothetical protein
MKRAILQLLKKFGKFKLVSNSLIESVIAITIIAIILTISMLIVSNIYGSQKGYIDEKTESTIDSLKYQLITRESDKSQIELHLGKIDVRKNIYNNTIIQYTFEFDIKGQKQTSEIYLINE